MRLCIQQIWLVTLTNVMSSYELTSLAHRQKQFLAQSDEFSNWEVAIKRRSDDTRLPLSGVAIRESNIGPSDKLPEKHLICKGGSCEMKFKTFYILDALGGSSFGHMLMSSAKSLAIKMLKVVNDKYPVVFERLAL